jgi:hypothetical protein
MEKGHFTLVQMDSARKGVAKNHCSGDLEEVIDRLLDEHKKTRSPASLARDFGPVLESIKNLSRKYPCLSREDFPANWTDSLDLYGCLVQELDRLKIDLDSERKKLAGLIFECGPEWVWKNRLRLVAEIVFHLRPCDDQGLPPESLNQFK